MDHNELKKGGILENHKITIKMRIMRCIGVQFLVEMMKLQP